MKTNSVGAIRVSSTKQGLIGDSPEQQKRDIEYKAKLLGVTITKWFRFYESASGDIQPNQEAVTYCIDPNNNVKYLIFKSIERFTRGGAFDYLNMVKQLSKNGVQPIDCYGVIGTIKVNTLAPYGISYSWSEYDPTRTNQIISAEQARDNMRMIQTQMIGAQINYVRLGYWVRSSRMGYMSVKQETVHGKRYVLEPHPIEAPWFIRGYELRIQGILADEGIVKEINALGYKSRRQIVRSKVDKTKIIGFKGEKPLTVKQFQSWVQNPIYAGVNCEKWLIGKPRKLYKHGLVTIEMFNKANRGRKSLVQNSFKLV